MSAPGSRSTGPVAWLVAHGWWLLLALALTLLWLATARRVERVDAVTDSPTWSVDAPPRDADSPTGYARGQRRLIVPGHHSPSFWWIMDAQQGASECSLRFHHTGDDAARGEREICRTAPYRWWLMTVGLAYSIIHHESLGCAIERGALFADPLLLALLLIAGATYSARSIGPFAALGFVAGAISLFPLAANFQPGAPDPHSLAWVLALGSVLPLFAALRKSGRSARAHVIAAGILGGVGFWNDAQSQAPLLLATFLGALTHELVRPRRASVEKPLATPAAPPPWRAWAVAGAATILAASVVEFAPAALSWSLDTVHPLHAVVWWGMGEALRAAAIWSRDGRKAFDRRALALLGAAVLAILAWPVTGFLQGSGGLLSSDFHAIELANHPAGGLAQDLRAWLHGSGSRGAKGALLLPCVIFFVLLARITLGRIDREQRARLAFPLVVALFAIGLAWHQLRWWNLVDVLVLVSLAALFAESETRGIRARLAALATVLPILPGLFVGFPPALDGGAVKDLSPLEAQALIARDFSYGLVKRSASEPVNLFAPPFFSSAAAFYGGFRSIVWSDGESKSGFLAAIRIASAATEQEASILLQTHKITHLALPLWDPMLDQLVRLGMMVPAGQPLPEAAFAVALQSWEVPVWLRPMNYTVPRDTGLQEFDLRAFATVPEQETDLFLSRLADLFLERGQMREAQSVAEALGKYPRSVAALGSIARVHLARRDAASLQRSMETLIPYLGRRSTRDLPADRHISLATLLIQTNHLDESRDQVTACLEDLDTETLRTLTPTTLVSLVALSRSLAVPFGSPDLEAVAMELIPPGIRAGLKPR